MTGYISGIVIGTLLMISLIALAIFFYIKGASHNKKIRKIGQSAEDKINGDIKTWAKHTKNIFIPATIFKYGKNKVFEVDSIIVTNQTVIVVEIKSINGGIEGKGSDLKWTKVLGNARHEITNPVIQNQKHIDHIIKMIETKTPIVSLVVYSNRADYLRVSDIPSHAVVIKHSNLFNTLDQIIASIDSIYSNDKIIDIAKLIKTYKATKKEDIQLHKNITRGGR
ncbi:MAG: NERD domain-containing protein [Mycoplasmataceae bacterium]|nr:NERD domain-containing protein [Mycoplasmataceae bacterium]